MRLPCHTLCAILTLSLHQAAPSLQPLDEVPDDAATRVTISKERLIYGQRRDDRWTLSAQTRSSRTIATLLLAPAGQIVLSPALAPSGALYFESTVRIPPIDGREDTDVWIIPRRGAQWGTASPLGPPFDSPFNEHYPTADAAGTICFNSARPGGLGRNDIYCVAPDDRVVRHIASVSSPSQDISPWLNAAGDRLLFAANRPGGFGGWDLYLSIDGPGGWSAPRNLGPSINSPDDETWAALSSEGDQLLLRRVVAGKGGRVYVVPFDPMKD